MSSRRFSTARAKTLSAGCGRLLSRLHDAIKDIEMVEDADITAGKEGLKNVGWCVVRFFACGCSWQLRATPLKLQQKMGSPCVESGLVTCCASAIAASHGKAQF